LSQPPIIGWLNRRRSRRRSELSKTKLNQGYLTLVKAGALTEKM
jgi:hypothetical protein